MTTIAVTSGKGSPGATFVAVNLAGAFARLGRDVALVDLDMSGGDIGAYLGLDPRKGLHALSLITGPRPSTEALQGELQFIGNFGVVGGVNRPATPETMDVTCVAKKSEDLAPMVLFDIGRLPGPGLNVLERADIVLLVVRPDVVSVLGGERALTLMEASEIPKERVRIVVTARRRWRVGDVSDIGGTLNYPVTGVIPWSPSAARRALESQKPASGRIGCSFTALAKAIAPDFQFATHPSGEVAPVGA